VQVITSEINTVSRSGNILHVQASKLKNNISFYETDIKQATMNYNRAHNYFKSQVLFVSIFKLNLFSWQVSIH